MLAHTHANKLKWKNKKVNIFPQNIFGEVRQNAKLHVSFKSVLGTLWADHVKEYFFKPNTTI